MSDHLTPRVKRYGVDTNLPERRELRAGPISCILENADLRYIKVGSDMVVLRLYMAVRDRNWATIEPRYTRFDVEAGEDSFRVEIEVKNISEDVDFAWSGVIEGTAEGVITYRMDGAPRKPFLKNRIGFCVLHPMELAGVAAITTTPNGVVEGRFPDLISPDQPFIDMTSISHKVGLIQRATISFEGDLFEMEDQRNWTDASYKTYGTPLRIPYPVEVTPETSIRQTVSIALETQWPDGLSLDQKTVLELRVSGMTTDEVAKEIGKTVQVVRQLQSRAFQVMKRENAGTVQTKSAKPDADVVVDLDKGVQLPPIGFGAGRKPLPDSSLAALQALKPAHLWADLDLGTDTWRERLRIAAENAAAVEATLDLSVMSAQGEQGWDALAAAVRVLPAKVGRLFAFPPVTLPIVFPRQDLATHRGTVASAKRAFSDTDVRIGGGTRAYFTELNRATSFLPVDELADVTYTINAQVHAVDNLSVIETLAAQAETVRSAKQIADGRPVIVGPVTLKAPNNPNATAEPPPPGPDRLPDPVDPRQLSLLAAGWTIGSIHRLVAAGADALTYYELAGWRGLVERTDGLTRRDLFPSLPGGLFPLYHVFAALADFEGGEILDVQLADGLHTEALAVRSGDRVRILVASFSEEARSVTLHAAGVETATIVMLDETTYEAAATDQAFFATNAHPLDKDDSHRFAVELLPFALACIDGVIATG